MRPFCPLLALFSMPSEAGVCRGLIPAGAQESGSGESCIYAGIAGRSETRNKVSRVTRRTGNPPVEMATSESSVAPPREASLLRLPIL